MPHALAAEDLEDIARRLVDEAFDALTATAPAAITGASAGAR